MTLKIGSNLADPARTIEHARLSEHMGFDFVGAGEHIYRDQRPGITQLALSALATAAGATQRISLLSSVVIAPIHHPVMLAKEAAVLDVSSGGRLILGVGVGGEFPTEFAAFDISLRQRGRRTTETIQILKKLWAGKNVDHAGRYFSFPSLALSPAPAQAGGPPIWVGGRSEAAMARAAKYGDGWLPYLYHPSRYARSVETVSALLTQAGRDTSRFAWGLHLMTAVGETYEQAVELAVAGLRAGYLYDGDYRELAKRYCLVGTPEDCIAKLKEFEGAGTRLILLSWLAPPERIADQIRVVGEQVIPQMRRS